MRLAYQIITIALIAPLSFSGCSKKEDQTNFVSKSLNEVVSPQAAPVTQPAAASTTSGQTIHPAHPPQKPPIGIIVDNGRIIIDTQQTKDFLENLAQKVDSGFKKIEHDLKNGQPKTPNATGITVSQDRIEIDLNKTEKFMEKWIKSMESVGKELDNVFRELDKSLNP